MDEIRKYIPLFQSDYELLQKYLEEQAAKGWFAQSLGLLSGKFIAGEPRKRRYRVIPGALSGIGEDEKNFYEEAGWCIVKSTGSWSVLYSDDDDAADLFTDESSFKHRIKWYIRVLIAIFIFYVPLLYTMGKSVLSSSAEESDAVGGIILSAFGNKPYATIAFLLLTIVIVYLLIKVLFIHPRIEERWEDQISITKRVAFLNSVSILLVIASVVLMFIQGE